MSEPARPPRSLLLGVFLISACVLALEVALTRIFSAVLRYHFVFLVISVAVCGLGVGGMLVYSLRQLRHVSLAACAGGFGLAALAFLTLLFKLILPHCPDALWLIALLVLMPFVFAGMFLSIAFRDFAGFSGLLYAYDLTGAALAAVAVVAAMQLCGAVNAYLLAALLACMVGFTDARRRGLALVASAVTLAALVASVSTKWLDIPPIPSSNPEYAKPLFAELADKTVGSRIIHSEWDAFARTDVVQDPQAGDDVRLVYTNGHVPTNIVRYDEKTKQYRIPNVIGDVPFAWRPPKQVLCIGPGAGLDLLLAHRAGATRIDGIEVNPAIPRILRLPQFQKFGGDPYGLPGVNVQVGDGRTFVLRSRREYDLIFMALTKTATSSGGVALVEGYLYTEEAFRDYLARLAPRGQLVLVTDGLAFNVRLLTTALRVLMRDGTSLRDALRHLALLSVPPQQMGLTPYQFALIVSKSPIDPAAAHELFQRTRSAGYQELFLPGEAAVPPLDQLAADGMTLEQFAAHVSDQLQMSMHISQRQPLNLMPVTDDRPFFLDLTQGVPPMLLPLLAGTLAALVSFSAFTVGKRVIGGSPPSEIATSLLATGYFACLGVGFMLIEIPLMQKLILVLGHPTLALTVVLAALLLGGGVGSGVSQRLTFFGLLGPCFVVAVIVRLCGVIPFDALLPHALTNRIGLIAAGCLVFGMFLGTPFPLGLRALSQRRPDDIPWMWGVNGLTSVLGSLLAAIGAKFYGFQAVFLGGAACYLLAGLLGFALLRTPTREADRAE